MIFEQVKPASQSSWENPVFWKKRCFRFFVPTRFINTTIFTKRCQIYSNWSQKRKYKQVGFKIYKNNEI